MKDRVRIDIADHVATVTLNRPEKMNALDTEMFHGIIGAGETLRHNADVRAVVLTGSNRAFCAGIDLSSLGDMSGGTSQSSNGLEQRTHGNANLFQQATWIWRELPIPVIAAVNGVAFGGGFQIMLGADIRIVHPGAKLSIMEIQWGLVPDMAGMALMFELARGDLVRELTYTGRRFSGAEALEYGFATQIDDDPLAGALTIARTIALKNPHAIEANKRLMNQASQLPEDEILLLESIEQDRLLGSPNQREAVAAGLAKRPAKFEPVERF